METISLNFNCSYYDDRASLARDLLLTYYIQCQINSDASSLSLQDVSHIKPEKKNYFVSLFNRKSKKIFLKKTEIGTDVLPLNQLYIKNTISLFARKLFIVSFADKQTQKLLIEDLNLVHIKIKASTLSGDLASAISALEKVNYRVHKMNKTYESKIQVIMTGYCEKENSILSRVKSIYPTLGIKEIDVNKEEQEVSSMLTNIPETETDTNTNALLIILPHIIISGKVGQLLKTLLKRSMELNFNVDLIKSQVYSVDASKAVFEIYKGVWLDGFYHNKSCHLSSGNSISIAVSSTQNNCVESIRETCGPLDIKVAQSLRSGSLRAVFGVDKIKSGVHCTDLAGEGSSDVNLVFNVLF